MQEINNLAKSKIEKAWTVNNSMTSAPASMAEATKRVVQILDVMYENIGLQALVNSNAAHLRLRDQNMCLDLPREFEEHFESPTLELWDMWLLLENTVNQQIQ
jgi:hypothetical protein